MTCFCCGSTALNAWLRKNGYQLVRCHRCGHVRLAEEPLIDSDRLYDEQYYFGHNPEIKPQGLCSSGTESDPAPEGSRPSLAASARRQYWLGLLEARIGGPARLLDVGCGTGALLDLATASGWRATGQDISPVAARVAAQKGHRVVLGDLSKGAVGHDRFEAAVMIEVIEHLFDPRPTLRRIAEVLGPGGWLLMTTGDIGTLRARLEGRFWGYLSPPIHVSFFTREAMTLALHAAGFHEVVFPLTSSLAFPTGLHRRATSGPITEVARKVRRLTRCQQLVLASTRG